jgi:hypothetical protein
MLKKLSMAVAASVAGLALVSDDTARAQTARAEGRIEARAARQAGRATARTFGDFGYYRPGYYGPAYAGRYAGPAGYYAGPGYYNGPGYYSGPGYYGGYYRGPAYNGAYPVAPRAYLGITMSETADGVVRVSGVRPSSPADMAGLRPGDILLAMDGRDIYAAQDVTRMVARHVPGEAVRLDLDRNGQTDRLEVVLATPASAVAGAVPRATYPSEYPVDRSEYPAYVEPYEILPVPRQAQRVPDAYVNPY